MQCCAKAKKVEGHGCYGNDDFKPNENYGHVASHYSFPIAMGILIYWDEYFNNPKMAIALSIPALISLAYHSYLSRGDEAVHFVCNCLMTADYLSIMAGLIFGLLWNIPLAAPTYPFYISAILALLYLVISDYHFMSRTMHAIWHFIALVPLLMYIAIDLKPFQDDLEPADDIKVAAQVLFFVVIVLTTIATVRAFLSYNNRTKKYEKVVERHDSDTKIGFLIF